MRHVALMRKLIVWTVAGCLAGGTSSLAAPPEGKGQGQDKEPQGQAVGQQEDRTPPGQERQQQAESGSNRAEQAQARAENRVDRAEARAADAATRADEARVERQHPHQDRQNLDRADRETGASNAAERGQTDVTRERGRSDDHAVRGREAAQAHVRDLVASLAKLDHARWSFNPHDTRGQGNMGKVDMRDPFGFDKDSGRVGAERGRPIRESETTNLTELVVVDFQVVDGDVQELQKTLNGLQEDLLWFQENADWYFANQELYPHWTPEYYSWLVTLYQEQIDFYQALIASYELRPYDTISVIDYGITIDYALTVPEDFEGTTLLVTTRLTSLSAYDDVAYWNSDDSRTWTWEPYEVHVEVGQVVVEDTQEITVDGQTVFNVSYDPPTTLVGDEFGFFGTAPDGGQGYLVELSVTVTDPITGASYTTTYDRQINLYRCPYGIVYDKTTGRAIVGATVTIHEADGSIVLLDKAANPNVTNPQTTDATGRYNAKLAIGKKYYLTVTAPGYAEYRSPLFSEQWHIVREDVALTPLAPKVDVNVLPLHGKPGYVPFSPAGN